MLSALLTLAPLLPPSSFAGAQGPADLAARFETLPGLAVSAWAARPHVDAPISLDIDLRARVWVLERNGRIRVLEDSNGDGACDAAVDFAVLDAKHEPRSICVVGARVFVTGDYGSWLLVDGDGDADRTQPWPVDAQSADKTWGPKGGGGVAPGPEGRLWMTAAPKSDLSRQALGAFALDGRPTRWMAFRLPEPREVAVDSFGQAFFTGAGSPGAAQLVAALEGGNGEDLPRLELGAGEARGIAVYESNVIAALENEWLVCDPVASKLYAAASRPEGAGWALTKRVLLQPRARDEAEGAREMLRCGDVAVGTDGAVFVSDEGGRILRLFPVGRRNATPRMSLDVLNGQLACLLSPAAGVRASGFERLAEAPEGSFAQLESIARSRNPRWQARALWLLARSGDRGAALTREFLSHENPDLRATAFRALVESGAEPSELAPRFFGDPSPAVRALVLRALAGARWNDKQDPILGLLAPFAPEDAVFVESVAIAARADEELLIAALGKRGGLNEAQLAALTRRLTPPDER